MRDVRWRGRQRTSPCRTHRPITSPRRSTAGRSSAAGCSPAARSPRGARPSAPRTGGGDTDARPRARRPQGEGRGRGGGAEAPTSLSSSSISCAAALVRRRRAADRWLPNIAALRRHGVSFAQHFTAANDCTPSRAALLTGLYTHQTGCLITGGSTLDPGFPTWGTMLREQGYDTYWFGKWHLTHGDSDWTGGERASSSPTASPAAPIPSPDGGPGQGWRVDPQIATQFDDWFAARGREAPWCTTVSFVNPHDIAWWYGWSDRVAAEASAPRGVLRAAAELRDARADDRAGQARSAALAAGHRGAFVRRGAVHRAGATAAWMPFLDLYLKLQRDVDAHIGAGAAHAAQPPGGRRQHGRRLHLRPRRVRRLARHARQGRRRRTTRRSACR